MSTLAEDFKLARAIRQALNLAATRGRWHTCQVCDTILVRVDGAWVHLDRREHPEPIVAVRHVR